MEPANLELIEQPLPYWDIEGMARLRQKVVTPVFADEAARELHHIKQIIDLQAADGPVHQDAEGRWPAEVPALAGVGAPFRDGSDVRMHAGVWT